MQNKLEPATLLRIFLGLVFLSAGVYRVFNWQQVVLEFSNLKLESTYLPLLTTILETVGGLFLIFNFKIKVTIFIFIAFLFITLSHTFIFFGESLIRNASELFTFRPNPTDFFLHLTYLIILAYLFFVPKKQPK